MLLLFFDVDWLNYKKEDMFGHNINIGLFVDYLMILN